MVGTYRITGGYIYQEVVVNMKAELINYLRTRNIESFYKAVEGGLTYDEYVTYTRRPLLEVNYINPLRFYTVCVQRDVRWLYVLDPDLLGRVTYYQHEQFQQRGVWDELLISTFYQNTFIEHDEPNTIVDLEQVFTTIYSCSTNITSAAILLEMQAFYVLINQWEIKTELEALAVKRMCSKMIRVCSYYNSMQFVREYQNYKNLLARTNLLLEEYKSTLT